jgi:hypothetical protein
MQSRREFLKLLSMALGASLTGCGSSGTSQGVAGGTVPLSYQFVPLVRSGQALPRGEAFFGQATGGEPPFIGGVMINDKRQIAFHAADQTETRGIYQVDVDASGTASDIKKIVREGDVLPNGTVVDEFSDGDLNNSGDFLVQIEDPEGVDSLQYCPDGGDFEKLTEVFQAAADNITLSGEICECQALSDDGRALFVAEYYDEDGEADGEGLFSMPVNETSQAQLLFSKNDLLPGTISAVSTIGATEVGSGGQYLALGSAAPTMGEASVTTGGHPLTYIAIGRPGETPQLLAADPLLGVTTEGVLQASSFMCPRLGPAGVGTILQLDADKTELRLNQELLLQADFQNGGSRSPRGAAIVSMFPPVFGPGGLVFLQVFTTEGTEIVLYNGSHFRTILSRGDNIAGKIVEDIMFGALPESVNSQGELVALVVFNDGETVVLLGLPV